MGKLLGVTAEDKGFGDRYSDGMAEYITRNHFGIKGFNSRGLNRMKQFYETYQDDEFVSPLVTQICWSNHLLILAKGKSMEEFLNSSVNMLNGLTSKKRA